MVAIVFLLLLAGGIGFAQVVSDPREVTLAWLRLGGIIAAALMGVAAVVAAGAESIPPVAWTLAGLAAGGFTAQLVTAQLACRRAQRLAGGAACVLAAAAATSMLLRGAEVGPMTWQWAAAALLSAALLGGILMTMLLGHAYLTAGNEMTQRPFLRLVRWLLAVLALRLLLSFFTGLWPYLQHPAQGFAGVWDTVVILARYLVGLLVPAVFLWMADDCVRRRSNQSATGILYVTLVLIIIGEGAALALVDQGVF